MILLVSDTHNNEDALERVVNIHKGKELSAFIHLGDVSDFSILEKTESLTCEKYLVKGNNDIINLSSASHLKRLGFEFSNPPFEIFIDGFGHIAIMHEPFFIEEYLYDNKTKYIFYGHTHRQGKRMENGKTVLNPGSLSSTMNFRLAYALINKDSVEFKHL